MEVRHPRFPSLSRAIRAGIQLVPDAAPPRRYFGVLAVTGRLGCDALAAAWFAEYYDGARPEDEDRGLKLFLSAPLHDAYPALASDAGVGCALGLRDCVAPERPGRSLEAKIIHLQDEHGFSRDQVADWLETQRL